MKKINILLVLFTIAALPGWSQVRNAVELWRVSVTQDNYYLKGDSVYLDMTIALNNVEIAKRGFLLLTPELRNDTMNVSMDMPPVMINGKNRQRAYNRMVALGRQPIGVGRVIDGDAVNASRTYRYSTAVAYEPWMRYAAFGIREEQCECDGPITPVEFRLLGNGMENRNPAKPSPVKEIGLSYTVSFKLPNPEPVKTRSESGKAFLDFAVGRSELRPDFMGNASELTKIGSLIQRIQNNPYTTITQVVIDGYASPEGSSATNMTLSSRRAIALKDYIHTAYGLNESLFQVTGRGEDWTGLEDLMEASNKHYKDAALLIIRSSEALDGREKKMKSLLGDGPYREILTEMYPKLRRSDYELKYTVIPFTIEQGRIAIEANPQLMSLNEMFLVAKSYPPASAEYHRVFDIAAGQFPNSDIANLNAAANAISAKNTAEAERYLAKVATHDAAWANNMGVIAALKGDFRQAAAYFESAKAAGNLEAVKNLSELEKLDQVAMATK